jgi:hypothetical protein
MVREAAVTVMFDNGDQRMVREAAVTVMFDNESYWVCT